MSLPHGKAKEEFIKIQRLIRNGGSQDFTLLESQTCHSTGSLRIVSRGSNFKKRKINIKTSANLLIFYVMYYKLSLALYRIFL